MAPNGGRRGAGVRLWPGDHEVAMDRERNEEAGRPTRTAKLWRVLVLGGAMLAAACGAGSKDRDGSRGDASAAPGSGQKEAGASSEKAEAQGGEGAGGVAAW
jgi:hypothetical protein